MASGEVVPFKCEECGGEFTGPPAASAADSHAGRPLDTVWA